jgi:hypothetical protein
MPEKVEAYKTEDGRLFLDCDEAFRYEIKQRLRAEFTYSPDHRDVPDKILDHAKNVHEILSTYLLKQRLTK